MSDKAHEHAPDAPMPARPDDGGRDLAGGPGDIPSRPDGAVLDEDDDGERRDDEAEDRRVGGAGRGDADREGEGRA